MRPFRTSLAFMILAGFLACSAPGCGGGSSLEKDKVPVDPSKQMNLEDNMPGYKDSKKK